MSSEFLDERRKCLEEKFFFKKNKEDISELRADLDRNAAIEQLRRASGMDNDAVLGKLVDLGLNADTMTALSLVPLLKVAWADGQVQENERGAIMEGARGKGIAADSPGAKLLESWLDSQPDTELFEVWASYIETLRVTLTKDQTQLLRSQITRFARAVAEADGGFLGFRAISVGEKEALAWIDSVFDDNGATSDDTTVKLEEWVTDGEGD